MTADQTLLELLEQDPESGMAALIETYSGLLWAVCRTCLADDEDVKDCVNESFAEFYRTRERFDPEKGTLKAYLASVARHVALHRVRQNKWWEKGRTEARAPGSPFSRLEDRDALRRALESLDPVDETILRMKYYEGKTAREIAESLGLPYETVKKRHQRGLKKLLRALLTTLLILAALTVLAACAYLVLRYFGFVPRYGVNRNPEEAVYVLQESAVIEDGPYTFHLEDAWWREGTLFVDMTYTTGDSGGGSGGMAPESETHAFFTSLEGLEGAGIGSVARGSPSPYGETPLRLIFEGGLPPDAGGALTLTLTLDGTEIPLTLETAEESTLGETGAYSLAPDGSGLLAVPRLERGSLIVSVYPLDGGAFSTQPSLTRGVWGGYGGPEAPVTVTSADSSVLTGEPLAYTPFSGTAYTEWDFGPAEAGDYVLDIPYVYQNTAEDTQPVTLTLPLPEEEVQPGLSIELPGGVWTVERIFPVEDPSAYLSAPSAGPDGSGARWWAVACSWESEDPARTMAAIPVQAESRPVEADGVSYPGVSIQLWTETVTQDGASGTVQRGFLISALGDPQEVTAKILPESICYRWNHAFSLELEVPPEEELPSFSASAGQITLTASPRRANGEVWIAMEPSSQLETIVPAAGITRGPALAGTAEDITLTAADGAVYAGVYRPGREDGYSDWGFGDLPAGSYTLRVPYLYLTDETELHTAVPLPQTAGESFVLEPLALGFGTSLSFASITGFGAEEGAASSPGGFAPFVISSADGTVTPAEETPLRSQLALSFSPALGEGAEYELADVSLALSVTDEASFQGACAREYGDTANPTRLTGLTLRHRPGLRAAVLTVKDPVYRWNHVWEIPVEVPEA